MSNQIPSFGYISSGEIHLINSDFSELKVDSYFAQKTKENAQANQNRHGWKNNAELGAFDSWGGAKYSHWNEHKVIFTSFSQSKEKEYLYSVCL